jgi:ribosomal protein S6
MIVSGFGGTRLKLEILYNGFKAINYPIKKRIATTIFVRWRIIIRLDQLIKELLDNFDANPKLIKHYVIYSRPPLKLVQLLFKVNKEGLFIYYISSLF